MRKRYTLHILMLLLTAGAWINVHAQKEINCHHSDARFTLRATRYWSSMGGWEEYKFYVRNNSGFEYQLVYNISLDLYCVGTKTYKLGYNRIVSLKPGEEFTPDDDYSHIYMAGKDNGKDCRKADGESFTLFRKLDFTITDIVNVTVKKDQEEKARIAAEKEKERLLEEKKAKDAAAKKAAADLREKEIAEKAAADKVAADKAAADKQSKDEADKKTAAAGAKKADNTVKASTPDGSSSPPPSEESMEEKERERKAAEEKQAAEEKAAAEAAAEEAARAEQAARDARQSDYDAWKTQADKDQAVAEAAAIGSSFSLLMLAGSWIYNDKMGVADPAFVYDKPDKKKRVFHLAIEWGYSLTHQPMLFASDKTTMINGSYVTTNEMQKRNAFLINLDGGAKMGLEHKNYGFYGVLAPKAGFSPIFDAFQLTVAGGLRMFAGAKWVKFYVEYTAGNHSVTLTDNDVEEDGKGVANNNFRKKEWGLMFTLGHDAQFRRTHLSIGFIKERLMIGTGYAYSTYHGGQLVTTEGRSPAMRGFAFSWKQDHTFNFYCNYYPTYLYAGEIPYGVNGTNSTFKDIGPGTFFELGFIRSVDFF